MSVMDIEKKKIGTHSGSFHCDEALACYLLHQTSTYSDAEITRTRDGKILDTLDIIVDVGGVYDPEKQRFDHHQRGFTETLGKDYKTKLSSAGLVYKHFGHEIIANICGTSDKAVIDTLFKKIYIGFLEAIDGIDNGINQYTTDAEKNYRVSTDLSSRVSKLNPRWNEKGIDMDERFKVAMALTGGEFRGCVEFYFRSWLPARTIVKAAIEKRLEVSETGQIVRFDQHCPWKEHLLDIEVEMKIEKPMLYSLFQDQNKRWRVQAIPVAAGAFESRKPLPKVWCGLRDEELSKTSGIDGCIFVHASGFIGGNATYEGAFAMAERSMEFTTLKRKKPDSSDD